MEIGGYALRYGVNNGVKSQLEEADKLWEEGLFFLRQRKKHDAELSMRASLARVRDAFHLASEAPEIGRLLHAKGRVVHDTFNCPVRMSGTTYYQECPVALSHSQLGMSIGGSADSICNICGKDPWDCDHIKGCKYNGVVMQKIGGACNICGKENCSHNVGEKYDDVEAVHILTNLKIEEVSLVKNPASAGF